jgi:hypothetical protein
MTPEAASGLISLLSIAKDLTAFSVLMVGFWLVLDGRLVTRRHMDEVVAAVVAARDVQTAEAKAREDEWRRLAIRGTDLIAPLIPVARERVHEQVRELRGSQADQP